MYKYVGFKNTCIFAWHILAHMFRWSWLSSRFYILSTLLITLVWNIPRLEFTLCSLGGGGESYGSSAPVIPSFHMSAWEPDSIEIPLPQRFLGKG